jgi:hypothetical protein
VRGGLGRYGLVSVERPRHRAAAGWKWLRSDWSCFSATKPTRSLAVIAEHQVRTSAAGKSLYEAYRELKRNLARLIDSDGLRAAMQLALELMARVDGRSTIAKCHTAGRGSPRGEHPPMLAAIEEGTDLGAPGRVSALARW